MDSGDPGIRWEPEPIARIYLVCATCGQPRAYDGPVGRCGDYVSVPGHECAPVEVDADRRTP